MRKSFRQFKKELMASNYEWFSFEVEDYHVHILFEPAKSGVLEEAKQRGLPLGGKYSAQLHKAHSSAGKEHLHVYEKNNQLFAMNDDGTAHDDSHKTPIPNRVADAITQKFPHFTLPKDNFIESAPEEIMCLFREQILLG